MLSEKVDFSSVALNSAFRGLSWLLLVTALVGRVPGLAAAQSALPVDTIVLCPVEFQPTLTRWVKHRESYGHRIRVVSPAPIAAGVKQQIRDEAASGSLKNVVLVGDAGDGRSPVQRLVPADFVSAQVNVLFGSEPLIATDSTYADLDDDGLPDLTIGRIPLDNVSELNLFIDRVIAYESSPQASLDETLWRRRISLVAGVGGLGQVVDAVVEQTAKQIITDLVPAEYQTTMTYGSWSSPYCPDPRRFAETSIRRFNEGCLFWVYMGHGDRQRLAPIMLPDQCHPTLDNNLSRWMSCTKGSPIAIMLACYAGATDGCNDGLAETMLRQANGPIAVLCGTRVTMPYGMSLLSLEMVDEYFHGDAETLGELTRLAKRRLVRAPDNTRPYRRMVEGMGQTLSPLPNMLEAERREHVRLMQLLGDPLLRIPRAETLVVNASEAATAGERMNVRIDAPVAGELLLELVYERDRFQQRPKRRRDYESSDAAFCEYQNVYEQAQNRVCWQQTVSVAAGEYQHSIPIPADAAGRCQIRAVMVSTVASDHTFAMGSAPLRVNKPNQKPSANREARKR